MLVLANIYAFTKQTGISRNVYLHLTSYTTMKEAVTHFVFLTRLNETETTYEEQQGIVS